jgi:polar amino acid transport system substrate-binding protein
MRYGSRRKFLASVCIPTIAALARGGKPGGKPRYIVGSSPTGVPFSFIDIHSFTLTGALVDVTRALAQNAGFEADFRETAFSALIPSLLARKIDIIAAAMLKTEQRAKVVDFSDPVYSYGAGVVVAAADKKEYRSLADLKGLRVGAQVGTRYVDQLGPAAPKEVKTYDSLYDILRDLRFGRIDAAYGDAPILRYEMEKTKPSKLRYAWSFRPPSLEDVCLIVRKGEPRLLAEIDDSIRQIGPTSVKAILTRWNLQ